MNKYKGVVMNKYIVVCQTDRELDGYWNPTTTYSVASHRMFSSFTKASEYAKTISASRKPIVVELWKDFYNDGESDND